VTGEVGIGGFSMRCAQGSDDWSDVHVWVLLAGCGGVGQPPLPQGEYGGGEQSGQSEPEIAATG
jgi:hypothetical protein